MRQGSGFEMDMVQFLSIFKQILLVSLRESETEPIPQVQQTKVGMGLYFKSNVWWITCSVVYSWTTGCLLDM